MRIVRLAGVMLLTAATAPAERLDYTLDPAGSAVSARVAFLGLASKTAIFPKVDGRIALSPARLDEIELHVTLDARALTAPDPVTLRRLKGPRFFDVRRYPTVSFVGHRLTMTGPTGGSVAGTITARGVTRPAMLAVTFVDPPGQATGREAIVLTGRTTIDRQSFGMTAYPLIVGRKVAITIRARMVPA